MSGAEDFQRQQMDADEAAALAEARFRRIAGRWLLGLATSLPRWRLRRPPRASESRPWSTR